MAVVLDEGKIKNILRQVEFYFSDSNLPRDKFLRTTVEQNEDGLVSLALICSFARMRSHLGLETVKQDDIPEETVLAVAEVLRKSSSLRVSEDGKKIGRSTELLKPEEVIEQVDSRTLAASPFPYDVKIEDVQTYFAQKGKVNSVRLPRHVGNAKAFCGTALIEFSEEDEAKSILLEKVVYAGVELELQPKIAFDVEREKKREEVKQNCSKQDNSSGRNDIDVEREKKREEIKGKDDSSTGSYPKGLIVAFKLIPIPAMASEKQKEPEILKDGEVNNAEVSKSTEAAITEGSETEEKPSEDVVEGKVKGNNQGNDIEHEEKAAAGPSLENDTKVKNDSPIEDRDGTGIVVPPKNEDVVTREDLKEVFQNFGTVMFIDYSMGKESGYVRFDDPDSAAKARAVAVLNKEGGLVVKKNYIATLEAVTGEAEKDYWSLLRANKDKHRENWSSRGRGRHNRGGRHFEGKRSRDFRAEKGRSSKVPKVADD